MSVPSGSDHGPGHWCDWRYCHRCYGPDGKRIVATWPITREVVSERIHRQGKMMVRYQVTEEKIIGFGATTE